MPSDSKLTNNPQVRCDDLLCGIFPPHVKTRAMATMQRGEIVDGKAKSINYEVPVRVMAVTEGYAMVRRQGCSPFVLEAKRVRLIPHNMRICKDSL